MKIYLGADHRGFELKNKIKEWLKEWGYDPEDMGAQALDPQDDYTVYAQKVAEKISKEDGDSKGILTCGSGIGVDIVANKFDGVRAGMAKNNEQVKMGREDDNMNVLVLAAGFTSLSEAQEMVRIFLETSYKKEERFERRLEDIRKIEKQN